MRVKIFHIELPDGSIALADIHDADLILGYAWQVKPQGGRKYARRQRLKTDLEGLPFWIMMHRILMGFPDMDIDHINGNCLDNRRSNLRLCTRAENVRNQRLKSNNKSGYKGVSWCTKYDRWKAYIMVDGRWIWLGYHDTPIEAAIAYNQAALEHHGEFARLNPI